MFHVRPELWTPFMPFGWFSHTEDGRTVGVLAGASLVFFAYRGFQTVSVAADDVPNVRVLATGKTILVVNTLDRQISAKVDGKQFDMPAYGVKWLTR